MMYKQIHIRRVLASEVDSLRAERYPGMGGAVDPEMLFRGMKLVKSREVAEVGECQDYKVR